MELTRLKLGQSHSHSGSEAVSTMARRYARPRLSCTLSYGPISVMAYIPSAPDLVASLRSVADSRDRAAFIILFGYFAPRLKTYFGGLMLPPGTADDLVQETMLRVWNKASQYDPAKGLPSAWVFTIARNLRVTGWRERGLVLVETDLQQLEDPAPWLDRLLVAREMETRLRQVLQDLPEDHADLLRASFFENKSHLEIAQERNMPLGTVKSQLRRTLLRLREVLTDFK